MKLSIELMPESCFGQSLRKRMKPYRWGKLRKMVIAGQGEHCAICGATGRLHCHELWEYDGAQHVQKLIGFQMLCSMCHGVEHYGMTNMLAAQGSVLLKDYIDHFCRVNGVDEDAFDEHLKEARALHAERSDHEWTTDLGEWEQLVDHEPAPPKRRRRNPDLDGTFQLPGANLDSVKADSEGNVEFLITGWIHHTPTKVLGYPRLSPSLNWLRLTLPDCELPEGFQVPMAINDGLVSYDDFCDRWMPQPLKFAGPVEVRLDCESGESFLLRASGIEVDRVLS